MKQSTELALRVDNAYKFFGKANDHGWMPWRNNHVKDDAERSKSITVAVDHLTFEIRRGEIFGILGPNGGGKSTLIRLIATLLIPDEGFIEVFGRDVVRDPMSAQRMINRVSVEASFFKKLSPMENLLYGARLYGLKGSEIRKQVHLILKRLNIPDKNVDRPMEEMSRGMQQKVAIARALLSTPMLLLLDEPTTGLDPRSKREVQAFIRELRDEHDTTILLTTHDMTEADILCDRVAIMDSGRVVALDTPEKLKRVAKQNGHPPTLEDVFLELTGKELVKETDMPI
ncbi:MAG TPA: ATP-binding cassette domain-containing protein [candidate division Zixibacteria bacterium]|nr:ATP-binding cassette domain-containing protein [candidate division Zixibacteria bacterium]